MIAHLVEDFRQISGDRVAVERSVITGAGETFVEDDRLQIGFVAEVERLDWHERDAGDAAIAHCFERRLVVGVVPRHERESSRRRRGLARGRRGCT
jgi:hypothetical protein